VQANSACRDQPAAEALASAQQQVFIAAACSPGSLTASDSMSGHRSASAQYSRNSTDQDGCFTSDTSQRDDLTMIAMSPAVPVGQAGPGASSGTHSTATGGPATDWGPVWVRLSPRIDGVAGFDHTVIIGEANGGAHKEHGVPGRLSVGCAMGQESLEAELVNLCIASGGKVRYRGHLFHPACSA